MKTLRAVPFLLLSATLAACTTDKNQLNTLAQTDSMRIDSLAVVRQELYEAVMTSAEFVTDITAELAKARVLASKPALAAGGEMPPAESDERKLIVAKIAHLVARLDSVQTRLASSRALTAQLSRQDSALIVKVAAYEKSVAELQRAAETQQAEFQAVIDGQATQIASLTTQVDTLNRVRIGLTDSVGRLTTEKNAAYYVVGTKDELIKKGILVAEGSKRFIVVGSRQVKPARALDPSGFTKIDRQVDRTITLPDGTYEILSRQNPTYATPLEQKNGKITGVLTIEQPEQFWEASPFLIIVRS